MLGKHGWEGVFRPHQGLVLGVLFVCMAHPLSGQIVVPTTGTLPTEPVTRSLLLGDDIDQVRAWWSVPVHSQQAGWKANIASYADRILAGDPNSYSECVLHSATGQSAAFRWAMTGQQADLDKAVDALTHLKIVPNPSSSDLTRAELTINYLCAYDFIRPAAIDATTRSTIETKLLGAANDIGDWNFLQQENNFLAKRGATRAMAGVLLRDQTLLDNGLMRLNQSLNKTTTDDGWYTDAQSQYLNYILPHLIPFVRAYHVGSGVNLWPNIEPFVRMTLGMRMPDNRTPNVQDGVFGTGAVNWFARGMDNSTRAALIWHFTTGDSPIFGNVTNSDGTYVDFFWSVDFSQGAAPPLWSPTFLSPGQAKVTVFRNDWSVASDYLMVSAGIDGKPLVFNIPIGHNHNDSGEILLCSRGKVVFPAGGYKRTDWSNWPAGFDSMLPENHNVILVDGTIGEGDQTRPEDFVYTNRLDATERGSFKGVCDFATLGYAYEGATFKRSCAFPNEDYFVVADVIDASASHTYGFNLMGRGTLTTLLSSSALLSLKWEVDGVQAIENLVSTHDLSLVTDTSWASMQWNQMEVTQRMRANISAAAAGFLSVIETGEAGAAPRLQIIDLTTADYTAVRVVDPNAGYNDTIFSQPAATSRTVNGITSDGRFVYVRTIGGQVDSAMMAEGTGIAIGGSAMVQTTSPITLSLLFASQNVKGTVSADGLIPNTELRFYGMGAIGSAVLNGQPVVFDNRSDHAAVILPAAGELSIVLAPPVRYSLSLTLVNGACGTVDISPNQPDYASGAVVSLTATSNPDRYFDGWEILDPNAPDDANLARIEPNAVLTLVMDANYQVTARFRCSNSMMLPIPAMMMVLAAARWGSQRRRSDLHR